jgi:cell division protease FtsH
MAKNEQPTGSTPPEKDRSGDSFTNPMRGILTWSLLLIMVLLMVHFYMRRQIQYKEIDYAPTFVNLVENKLIKDCELIKNISGSVYIQGESMPDQDGNFGDVPKNFRVYVIEAGEKLEEYLRKNGVKVRVKNEDPMMFHILSNAVPVLLVFGLIYFLFIRQLRNAGTGAMSFGKSRARLLARDRNKVTFMNVAGINEAKEEVQEIIEFLKAPKKFQKLGGHIPKGVLLMGPPGSGKTLLAKAIAGEADVPFFSISGSDFVEMFVGVGASRVRDMFEQAKKNAPCIIFIDEIDAVGRSRFSGIGGGHDEREQTLNALLVEMDGFETQEGIIIVAATNRPDVLDPALLRPGRFDRQIVIDLPMIDGREEILRVHSRKIKLDEKADLRRIARGTPGFSGADLENLLNEAALLAARANKSAVDIKDMEEARDKVRWGRERRSRVLDEKEKKVTAYHEAGHALVMKLVEESEPVHKITIIPRGIAYLGATMQLPEKDRFMEGKIKLHGILASLMGGRTAEEIIFGDITSGAASDIKEATRLARLMICQWGMSSILGPQTFGEHQELLFLGREISKTQDYSEATAVKIDAEVKQFLKDAHDRAASILQTNRDKLELIASLLIERETLDGRDIDEIINHGRLLSEEERARVDEEKELKAGAEKAAKAAAEASAGPPQPDKKGPPPLPVSNT